MAKLSTLSLRYVSNLKAPDKFISREDNEDIGRYRKDFQRDRDRILYSLVFRRLGGKTQVVLPVGNDHVRNRLTHTLEVAQIASIVAKSLYLDDMLTEAVSLGHDLGHTPFGHVGERAINYAMNNCEDYFESTLLPAEERGFKHNHQGVRLCCSLERLYPHLRGLNLTNFTLWGIKNHSGLSWKQCEHYADADADGENGRCYRKLVSKPCPNNGQLLVDYYKKYDRVCCNHGSKISAWSFEGHIVAFADEIAQRNHDVQDAYYAEILTQGEIIDAIYEHFGRLLDKVSKRNFEKLKDSKGYFIPCMSKFLLNFYHDNLISTSRKKLKELAGKYRIVKRKDFLNAYTHIDEKDHANAISFSEGLIAADNKFKQFIRQTILNSFSVQRMDGKGSYIINRLFQAYLRNPKQLHDTTIVYASMLMDNNQAHRKSPEVSKKEIGRLRDQMDRAIRREDRNFYPALMRAISDHISGMTDEFAFSEFSRLYQVHSRQEDMPSDRLRP